MSCMLICLLLACYSPVHVRQSLQYICALSCAHAGIIKLAHHHKTRSKLRCSLQCPCLVQVAINSQVGQGTVNLRASDYITMQKQLDQHQHEVSRHSVRLPRCSCSASCDQLALICLQLQQRMYDYGRNIVNCDSNVMFSAAYRMSKSGCATKCATLKTLCVGSKSQMRRGERINPRLANTNQGRTYTPMWCAPAQALADRGRVTLRWRELTARGY